MKAKLFSATVCLLTIFMVTAACRFSPAAVKDDLQTQAQRLLQEDSGDLKQLMQGHDFKAIVVLPLIFFFADVTGDGIPELFWGHFDTSITNSAWFHGYSLSEHRPMQAIHSGEAWSGVPCGETEEEESAVLFFVNGDQTSLPLGQTAYLEQDGTRCYYAYCTIGLAHQYRVVHKMWFEEGRCRVESFYHDEKDPPFFTGEGEPFPTTSTRELEWDHMEELLISSLEEYFAGTASA